MSQAVSKDDARLLADTIIKNIKGDFVKANLSKNLIETISIEANEYNGYTIKIPARMYDLDYWYKHHVVVPKPGNKSYASEVDKSGGFSGVHKDYLKRSIDSAIAYWTSLMQKKYGKMIKEEK